MEHECTMKSELTIAIDSIKNQNKWFMSVFAGIMVLLIIGMATIQTRQSEHEKQITKITDSYAPLIIVQDIYENNDKLIEIFQMIPETTKNDPRYLEAIRDREIFQREALSRAAMVKRGGYSSSNGSAE